jgi:hypothetical protein
MNLLLNNNTLLQISVVIVNRKENKLRKGVGYHWDLLILAIQVVVVGTFGAFCLIF